MHAIYSKHSQQECTQHCISKSPEFILNIATVVKTKVKTFHEDRDLLTSGLVQMHKSDTVYENKHHHRNENLPKKLVYTKFCCTTRHARLIKVVGGSGKCAHVHTFTCTDTQILVTNIHTLGTPTSRGSAVSVEIADN